MNLRNAPRLCSTVRDLLRNLDDPRYLRKHPLVARSLALSKNHAYDDPVVLLVATKRLIESAVAAMPRPLQTIIVRCDLGRELHRSVASSLGFSERYFYKLRRRALLLLGQLLSDAGHERLPCVQIDRIVDRLEASLCSADALKHSGDYTGAAAVLNDLAGQCSDACDLTYTNYLLADLFLDVNRLDAASEYFTRAKAAESLMTQYESAALHKSELHSIEAMLAMQSGAKTASGLTQRALQALHQLPHDSSSDRREKALCNLLLAATTFRQVHGSFGDALAAALEARNVLEQYSIDRPSLKVLAFANCSIIQYFVTGGTRGVIAELTAALSVATLHALPRLAAPLAAALCSIQSRKKDFGSAMRFGELALSLARSACTPDEAAVICADVARARLANGDIASAHETLAKADAKGAGSTVRGFLHLVAAESYVAERRFDLGLVAATRAAHLFETPAPSRFYGSALCVHAEALMGRGDRTCARDRIGEALEVLETAGTTEALARAYQLSAQICDNQSHSRAAKALIEHGKH
jgi:hypothetical protein